MFEAEIKLTVRNLDRIQNSLRLLAQTAPERVNYRDLYFDRPDSSLQRADTELRVRSMTYIEKGTANALLTYKGPPFHVETRSKEEIEIEVEDSERTIRILEALGFRRTIVFEKHCALYRLIFDGFPVQVTLVQVPELGSHFLECEIQLEEETGSARVFTILRKLATQLGLGRDDETSEYYTDLIKAARERARLQPKPW